MKSKENNIEIMRLETQLKNKEVLIEKLEYMIELLSSLNKNKEDRLQRLERKLEQHQILSQFNFN